MAWSVSKLSESYESRAQFEVEFINFPDTLLLNTSEKNNIGVKLRTSGFQFLSLGISPKKLKLDLGEIAFSNGNYYLASNFIKPQVEQQLSKSISVIELEKERLYVDLYQVISKKVLVEPNITLEMAQNHLLEGELLLEPNTISIKGPENEIDTIEKIKTAPLLLNRLTDDFTKKVSLVKPESLVNSEISDNSIRVSGKVVRFSEKEYQVPIGVINLPDGYRIRMFPDKVSLVCKAGVNALKDFESENFEVLIDCSKIDSTSNQLPLQLTKSPKNVYGVQLLKEQIEFVLEKL